MDRKLKKLEREQQRLMKEINSGSDSGKSSSGSLWQFLVGIVLLGAGLFWIFQSVSVTTGYGYGSLFGFGSLHVPSGTIVIPLLIGIVMLFLMEKKIYGGIVTAVGVVIILVGIITSVRLHFHGGNLFNYILMFGFTLVGGGLVLKNLFKK